MTSLLMTAIGALAKIGPLQPLLNRVAIDIAVGQAAPRPQPYSLWSPDAKIDLTEEPYVTWEGLYNRAYTGRHLPPARPDDVAGLPKDTDVVAAFMRPEIDGAERFIPSSRTTALFCFFAQWFTDSFLRTDFYDKRMNTSNHEIDLCQIYGLDAATAQALREGAGGRLRTEQHPTGAYPARLFDVAGAVRPEFATLPYVVKRAGTSIIDQLLPMTFQDRLTPEEARARSLALYATGLERGSNTIVYAALNALFVREHNRIAARLAQENSGWDDARLFEVSRNINIVQALKLVIEEYINHLAGVPIQFRLDRGFAERRKWYRANRITIEFDILYRWHPMIPAALEVDGRGIGPDEYRFNNRLLEELGVEKLLAAATRQPAGRIMLGNTPRFMWGAELGMIQFGRKFRLQSFNAYRRAFGLAPYTSWEALTGDAATARQLQALYGGGPVDRLEYAVGLFAEKHDADTSFGELLRTMVAVDAFSQIFTNPLLSTNVFDLAVGRTGAEIFETTTCLQDVVQRNAQPGVEVLAKFAR